MTLHPDFLHELRARFTGDLRLDAASRTLYSTDASMYQIEPLGVVIPRTQDDLQAAIELAAKYKIPILARGAGSSLGGQAIGEALILDCSRYLDGIVEIDPVSHSAIVEPGVVLANLNHAVAQHGLMFGPDPASAERATMGGVIGNNATGAHSILYGMSADHLMSADVILADGSLETWDETGKSKLFQAVQEIREKYSESIKRNFPHTWRNSAGYRLNYLLPWTPSAPPQWDADNYGLSTSVYDRPSVVNLASILAGSEGTLAVMRRAQVNLVPRPKNTILGVLSYKSVAEACDDVSHLLTFNPSAIELIPRMIIHLARSVPAYARQMSWVVGDPSAVLIVEFSGDRPEVLKETVRKIGDVLTIAESADDQKKIWSIRKVGLGILDSRPQSARPAAFIEDCAIPVEQLGEFVREVERILAAHNSVGEMYAHASGGCLHIRPILDLQLGEGVRALRGIAEQVLALTLRLGGTMSSEHGDGIVRGEWLKQTYGDDVLRAMKLLKQTADPDNLLNPNKMFDAPPMDSHLRYGENYQSRVWVPSLDFDHAHGLAGAIEQCNGQGLCRKNSGVMCPSFQATREEAFSTRGRANLLRALISDSDIDRSNLDVEAVHNSLDLCLACKGCTSECPSGVDMPRLKYEFMNEFYKTYRRPLHDYLFGYFHIISAWLAPIASLANTFMSMDWSRKLIAQMTGITARRPFPVYSLKRAKPINFSISEPQKSVIFLSDVFSRYLESDVEQAAFDILAAAGYDVKVLSIVGAGASLLSKGFIEEARKHAGKVLDQIKELDTGADLCIVGCEPPEIYCLKHEYMALMPERRAEIESFSERTWLLDEFLVRSNGVNNLRVAIPANENSPQWQNQKITFHPHCHQRAEGPAEDGFPTGTSATVEMLRSFGFDVDLIDAGCCGMAGTFGYDEEHYELSMQIGELGVFPKTREAAYIVSTGSACRMQIKHGTGKESVHPIVLIANLLER